jgi:hypothetical protein
LKTTTIRTMGESACSLLGHADECRSELSAFVDAAENLSQSSSALADEDESDGILSTFRDAANTVGLRYCFGRSNLFGSQYALTWAIKTGSFPSSSPAAS